MTMKSSDGKVDYREIRALTIRQPFPELILRRRKPYEIRSWRTNYRGPLLIHSAAKVKTDCARESGLKPETLATSAFVGAVVLSDVRPYTRADSKLLKQKRAIGGWSPGQLEMEMKRKSWLTFPASLELVFETPPDQLWQKILKTKGGWKNKLLSQMPEDLSMN